MGGRKIFVLILLSYGGKAKSKVARFFGLASQPAGCRGSHALEAMVQSWLFDLHEREEGKETPTWLVARLLEKSHFDNNKFKAHGVFTEECSSLVSPTQENPAAKHADA